MAGLRDIKRRINSVKNTQKITRAMKMVSAAKLRRSQDGILGARPYAYHLRALVNSLARRAEHGAHPLLRRGPDGGKIGLIVVTSDRGLCGAFNANIVNAVMDAAANRFAGREVELTVVGRKGADILRRRPLRVRATFTAVQDRPLFEAAAEIIEDAAKDFSAGLAGEVYCLYNEFKSAIAQRVTIERVLPFEAEEEHDRPPVDYLYEPSREAVFDALLHRHLTIQMQRMLLESAASEHGARMTAMDAATSNAGDMIARLTLQFNRARQDAITKELIEVVSGAEAL
jgi:F-type H+-transporting ATPase subunit gamma